MCIRDRSCPYTFNSVKVRENPNTKRSKVTRFRFYPVYQPQFRLRIAGMVLAKMSISAVFFPFREEELFILLDVYKRQAEE